MKESRLAIHTFIKKMKMHKWFQSYKSRQMAALTVLASVCETEVIDTGTNYHPLIICGNCP